MLSKYTIFLTLLSLLAPIVYGSFYNSNSEFEAYAVRPDPGWGSSHTCSSSSGNNWEAESCCWTEGGIVSPKVVKCQTCVFYIFPYSALECGDVYTPFIAPGGSVTGPLDGGVGPVGPSILPFNLRDILTIPENQSYSISVRHGPISDTIMIEIPKALSSSILNQSNVNQTATSVK